MAFAVSIPARHPLGLTRGRGNLWRRLLRLQPRCRPHGRSRPTPHPRTGASLPGTQASPRTGLTSAGRLSPDSVICAATPAGRNRRLPRALPAKRSPATPAKPRSRSSRGFALASLLPLGLAA